MLDDQGQPETSSIPHWILTGHLPRMSPAVVKLYLCLIRYADFESQSCFPSYRTIRAQTHLAFTTIKKSITTLCEVGLIQVSRGSRRAANLYRLARYPDQAEGWAADWASAQRRTRPRCPVKNPPTLPGFDPRALHLVERSSAPLSGALKTEKPHCQYQNKRSDHLSAPLSGAQTDILSLKKRQDKNKTHAKDPPKNQENQELFSDNYLSGRAEYETAHRLLLSCQIRGDQLQSLLARYDPADVITACRNAIARSATPDYVSTHTPGGSRRTWVTTDTAQVEVTVRDPRRVFNRGGYVINTLRQAARECHPVRLRQLTPDKPPEDPKLTRRLLKRQIALAKAGRL